ncbi:hypothetical protein F4808DRAFT_421683 [Astrocystis sublimbata]|nr:hypothetical protein F4808DRAFT_421683 [Astrocystis sublimbata]
MLRQPHSPLYAMAHSEDPRLLWFLAAYAPLARFPLAHIDGEVVTLLPSSDEEWLTLRHARFNLPKIRETLQAIEWQDNPPPRSRVGMMIRRLKTHWVAQMVFAFLVEIMDSRPTEMRDVFNRYRSF